MDYFWVSFVGEIIFFLFKEFIFHFAQSDAAAIYDSFILNSDKLLSEAYCRLPMWKNVNYISGILRDRKSDKQ